MRFGRTRETGFVSCLALQDQLAEQLLDAICTICSVIAAAYRIPTEDERERCLICAVSESGVESWMIEADSYTEAVSLLAAQLGLDLTDM